VDFCLTRYTGRCSGQMAARRLLSSERSVLLPTPHEDEGAATLMLSTRLSALFVAGAVASAAVAFLTRENRASQAAPPAEARTQPEPPAPATADWCAPGYEPVDDGCLALSGSAPAPRPLLVYLHGRYARDGASEEMDRQRRLATRATEHGLAVLALRGRLGGCTAAELSSWFCWPSNEHNADGAGAVVGSWTRVLEEAQRRAGSRTRFVLGFSNGGYFAGLLATRGLLEADAFVIAHGGPVDPVRKPDRAPPLLLLSADDDVAQDDMILLDGELTREHWPHDSYARSGAHGLTDEDIDAAIAFFARAREALPLDPPLRLHRPVHHAHDANEVANDATAEPPVGGSVVAGSEAWVRDE
jgi:predicted esterase